MADRRRHSSERWRSDAGDSPSALLNIPADASRVRRFEISISMTVRAIDTATAPWHALRIFADGQLQWSRRVPTQHPSPFDGLDYRFERSIAVGRALRLQAFAECGEARRLQLTIEAEETP